MRCIVKKYMPNQTGIGKNLLFKRAVSLIFQLVFGLLILFFSAGTFYYHGAWLLGGLYLLTYLLFYLFLPSEVKETRAIKSLNRPTFEKVLIIPMLIFGYGTYTLSGLDKRFGWTASLPLYMILLAVFIFMIGMGITFWAMKENPYFNKQCSLNESHEIISSGPYAVIRHPGYLGMMTYLAVTPIILESIYGVIPTIMLILLMIIRTNLEDEHLTKNFSEYKAYQNKVKNKLFKTYKS